jgi:sulfur-carrier protein
MKVKVLFFAVLKDMVGEGERFMDVSKGTTVSSLANSLFGETQTKHFDASGLLFSVNEQLVGGEYKLQEQDILALMPPVSGG